MHGELHSKDKSINRYLCCRPSDVSKYSLKFNGRLGRKLLQGELTSLQPYSEVSSATKKSLTDKSKSPTDMPKSLIVWSNYIMMLSDLHSSGRQAIFIDATWRRQESMVIRYCMAFTSSANFPGQAGRCRSKA